MDQGTLTGLLQGFQQRCSQEHGIQGLTVSAGRPDGPIVLLVHGIGGNAQHWTDPVSLNPNDTWLFNLAAPPPPNAGGLASSPPYQPGNVASWTQFLASNQVSFVTWSQSRSGDLLQYAVDEEVAVLRGLEEQVFAPYDQDVAANGGQVPPLVILCHSRGGLVTRAALKQLGQAGVPHLRKVITLCTPHHGSYMPQLADDYNRSLSTQLDFSSLGRNLPGPLHVLFAGRIDPLLSGLANRVREAMLHTFGALSQGPGFMELSPGSSTLQALQQDEQPLPNVQYHGYGGTQPTFVHFYLSAAGHVVHLLATASPFLVQQLGRIQGVAERYGGLAEIDQGDSAVGMQSSVWPEQFNATHQMYPVNHMQALIDPALQQAVLARIMA